jgi:uncharacterized protein
MSIASTALFSRAPLRRRRDRILQFPLARIVVALLFIAPALAVRNLLAIGADKLPDPMGSVVGDLVDLGGIALMLLAYRAYARRFEYREPLEVSGRGAAAEFGRGMLISLGVVGATVAIMAATGGYAVERFGSLWTLPHALIVFGGGAFVQVLLFRVVLFRLIEEWTGTWIAFAVTSLVFGGAHAANGHLTPAGFAGLVAGDLLLIFAFVTTRRLWLAWGIHAGWNFVQDGIFGMPNSGLTTLPSWITARIDGPAWMTGGGYGIEASVVAFLLQLVPGIWLLLRAIREGQFVRPRWVR